MHHLTRPSGGGTEARLLSLTPRNKAATSRRAITTSRIDESGGRSGSYYTDHGSYSDAANSPRVGSRVAPGSFCSMGTIVAGVAVAPSGRVQPAGTCFSEGSR